MKKLLFPICLGSVLLMMVSSCGATVNVKQERFFRTGIGAQERAVILLERYVNDNEKKDSEDKEQELNDCMREAMISDNGQVIQTLSEFDFRTTLFPGMKFENAPRSSKALLDLLRNDNEQKRIVAMSVRYLIIVDIRTYSSDRARMPLLGSSSRSSKFHATVLDATYRTKSGELTSDSVGTFGSNLQLFSRTERDACTGLGKAVSNFITSTEAPAPAKSN